MVRAEGLEPPQAIAHQDLNLARLPFRHARNRLNCATKKGPYLGQEPFSERWVGRPGLEPGTLSLRGSCCCQIELATQREVSNLCSGQVGDEVNPGESPVESIHTATHPNHADAARKMFLTMTRAVGLDKRLVELRIL